MTNIKQGQKQPIPQLADHTNVQLIYEYTEYHFRLVNRSIDILTTKLNVLLGLSVCLTIPIALLLLVEIKTKPQYYWFLTLEIVIGSLLLTTLYMCVIGFQPCASGAMTPPGLLMDENYYDSDEDIRLIITKTSIEALKELEQLRNRKALVVDLTVKLLFSTIVCEIISLIGFVMLNQNY